MNSQTAFRIFLQVFSILIFAFLLFSIFSIHTGLIGRSYIPPTVLTLTLAVAFRYVSVYHKFKKPIYRKILLVPITIAVVGSGLFSSVRLRSSISFQQLRDVFQHHSLQLQFDHFLPEWWAAVILVPAGVLALVGSFSQRELSPYPKPTEIREIAISPAYFGFFCTFFGLWAVLFVGVSIQRIIIIAPLFEELLKFGVALLIGSVLFDRSFTARIGVAIVIGSLFGLIEHTVTYATEPDAIYLFRTIFHMVTTALSVGIYTLFESQEEYRLVWISSAFSTLFHFLYNTFVVLSSIISVSIYGSQIIVIPLVYEATTIFLIVFLFGFVMIRHRIIILIHEPLESVLSDLV